MMSIINQLVIMRFFFFEKNDANIHTGSPKFASRSLKKTTEYLPDSVSSIMSEGEETE